jgi:hypothetical protein
LIGQGELDEAQPFAQGIKAGGLGVHAYYRRAPASGYDRPESDRVAHDLDRQMPAGQPN